MGCLLATMLFFCSFIQISVTEGYIKSVEDLVQIEIRTNETPVYGIFTWEKGMSLWVRVFSGKKILRDNIDLGNTNVLILEGKGKFLLELYAQKGEGSWKCDFVNEKKFLKMKNTGNDEKR